MRCGTERTWIRLSDRTNFLVCHIIPAQHTREQCLKILCGEYDTVRIPIHGLNIYIRQFPRMDIEELQSQLDIVRDEWIKVKHNRDDCELWRKSSVYHCAHCSV